MRNHFGFARDQHLKCATRLPLGTPYAICVRRRAAIPAQPSARPSIERPAVDVGQRAAAVFRHHATCPIAPAPRARPGRTDRPSHPMLQVTPKSLVEAPPAARVRIASLDALRGFNFVWILGADGMMWALDQMLSDKGPMVSSVGHFLGRQLTHVAWEGFRFYDLIFPLFIFITGVTIVFSLARQVEREGVTAAHLRVLRRALLLYSLGLIYYGGISAHWDDIRFVGVLQRIAVCYLVASLLFLNFNLRGLLVACAALLVGYWALMTFVPVPGIGTGSFAPDANLANWIDANYLPGRLWDRTRDPEGLLSTLPAGLPRDSWA